MTGATCPTCAGRGHLPPAEVATCARPGCTATFDPWPALGGRRRAYCSRSCQVAAYRARATR